MLIHQATNDISILELDLGYVIAKRISKSNSELALNLGMKSPNITAQLSSALAKKLQSMKSPCIARFSVRRPSIKKQIGYLLVAFKSVSIFWISLQACVSDSNRCNKPAWSRRA